MTARFGSERLLERDPGALRTRPGDHGQDREAIQGARAFRTLSGTRRFREAVRAAWWGRLGKLYAAHHARRFQWLREKTAAIEKPSVSVIELGCAEAVSLDYVSIPIRRYCGFDAGWQSGIRQGTPYGLEAARRRLSQLRNFSVQQSNDPADLVKIAEQFDMAIVMETFEYLPTAKLESYVSALAEKLGSEGLLLATMPNEKGLPLLCKAMAARVFRVRRSAYTAAEFVNAALGRLNRVPRAERGRKGFDYAALVTLVRRYFRHVRVESIGPVRVPVRLGLNVGMIASQSADLIRGRRRITGIPAAFGVSAI
jgi:Methyltransferase domain